MAKKPSFTKFEHEILPDFRNKINNSESTEDVKKFFVQTAMELFEHVFEGKQEFEYEDVKLALDKDLHYTLSEQIRASKDFKSVWNASDLPRIVARLAKSAMNRYKHLEKHPERTDSKIRM